MSFHRVQIGHERKIGSKGITFISAGVFFIKILVFQEGSLAFPVTIRHFVLCFSVAEDWHFQLKNFVSMLYIFFKNDESLRSNLYLLSFYLKTQ